MSNDDHNWQVERMNAQDTHRIFPVTTVKVVEAPMVMAAPSSVKTRRKNLSEDLEKQPDTESSPKLYSQAEVRESESTAPETNSQNDDSERSRAQSISEASTTPRTGRVSWAARMVHFVRNFRRRLSKMRHSKKTDAVPVLPDSPVVHRRAFGVGRKLTESSPSCPTLTVTVVDDSDNHTKVIENKEKRSPSGWSLRVDNCVNASIRRKLSAGSYDGRTNQKGGLGNRKITAPVGLSASSQEIANRLTEYVVNVKTSDRFGAGTDANVFLQLFGDLGPSEVFSLTSSNNVNKFERNQLDRFVLRDSPSVGKVQSIKIWHDNSGVGAAWHLAYVEVNDTNLGLLFRFPCHSWLSETGDSLGISRELRCFEVLEGQKNAVQIASGVSKNMHIRSDSLSALNVKSLPVTPLTGKKHSRAPPAPITILVPEPNTELYRAVPVESVFTPAPTRPAPVIRFPLRDDDDESSGNSRFDSLRYQHANTISVFSSHLLAEAAKLSLDGRFQGQLSSRKRTVYGSAWPLSTNHGNFGNARRISTDDARLASVSSSVSSIDAESDLENVSESVF